MFIGAIAMSCANGANAKGGHPGKKAAEQAEEQAKKAQEQAQEQAKKAQEQARENAKRASEQAADQNKPSQDTSDKQSSSGRKDNNDQSNGSDAKDGKAAAASGTATATRSGGDKGSDGKAEADKVPGTVAEWFQGIFKPTPVTGPTALGNTPTPAPAAIAPTTAPAKEKPPVTTATGHPVAPGTLTPPPFGRPEMLVANLPQKNLDRAIALGFQDNGRVSSLGLGLTRLVAPDGYTEAQARDMLREALPNQSVEINHTYRIYRTAAGALAASQSDRMRDPEPMATPCGTDRCLGASIINWQPRLRDCARNVRIGVIDTGHDIDHPALKGRAIVARRLGPATRAPSPDWHGTGVLALLAGDETSGTPGLLPDASYRAADIFYADPDGLPASDTATLIEALGWMEEQKVNIVNMSFSGPHDEVLKGAIAKLSQKGIVFVAAAGNDGPAAPPGYPAAYEQVIAVTAVNRDLQSYRHASRGPHITVAALGVDIWTAAPGGQGTYHSGTSFAVPYVSAVLATVYKQLPRKTKAEFLNHVTTIDLGPPGLDPIYGKGLLLAPPSCVSPLVADAPAKPATPVLARAGR